MPETLRQAHDFPVATLRDRNDEILERIDSDRRFKNDTVRGAFPKGKRLEKLFELYPKMTSQPSSLKKSNNRKPKSL
jgi:hypothetical protein